MKFAIKLSRYLYFSLYKYHDKNLVKTEVILFQILKNFKNKNENMIQFFLTSFKVFVIKIFDIRIL